MNRIASIALVLAFTLYVWMLYRLGSLYPANVFYLGISAAVLTASVYRATPTKCECLSYIVFVSITYRLSPFVVGSSLLGSDPDRFAIGTNELLRSGSTVGIYLDFYSSVPAYPLLSAITSLVMDVSAYEAIVAMTAFYAILLPIGFYYLSNLLLEETTGVVLSTLLFTLSSSAVTYSIVPIAQTLSTVYLLFAFGLLFRASIHDGERYTLLLLVVGTAMTFTHKFGTVVLCGGGLLLLLARRYENRVTKRAGVTMNPPVFLVCLFGVVSFGQWIYVSDFFDQIVVRTAMMVAETKPILYHPPEPAAATRIDGGFWDTLRRRGSVASVMIAGAVSLGALAVSRFQNGDCSADDRVVRYTYALGALAIGCTVFSLFFSSAINPVRMYIYAEPLMILVFFLVFKAVPSDTFSVPSKPFAVLFVALFAMQLLTPMAIPDHHDRERQYLTEPEVDAAKFEAEYIEEPVLMDNFYSHKVTENEYDRTDRTIAYDGDKLLNGDIHRTSAEYVHVRRDVRVYRLYGRYRGWWRLTYDPSARMEAESHLVYTSGSVDTFARRTE